MPRDVYILSESAGVTLILLSPKVHERKSIDKTRTIISVWDRIVEIASEPVYRGRQFMVESIGQQNLGIGRITERRIIARPDIFRGKDIEGS